MTDALIYIYITQPSPQTTSSLNPEPLSSCAVISTAQFLCHCSALLGSKEEERAASESEGGGLRAKQGGIKATRKDISAHIPSGGWLTPATTQDGGAVFVAKLDGSRGVVLMASRSRTRSSKGCCAGRLGSSRGSASPLGDCW